MDLDLNPNELLSTPRAARKSLDSIVHWDSWSRSGADR